MCSAIYLISESVTPQPITKDHQQNRAEGALLSKPALKSS
jgi:hypothetical protein